MGGKVSVITLNPDMTFREQKKRTDVDNVELSKNNKPSFTIGRSVFRELIPRWKRWLLGRKERNLVLYFDGANSCFEVNKEGLKSHESHIWSRKEKEKTINKLAIKSKAEQKAIETWQFFLLAGLGIMILVCQFAIMRGIRVF